MLTNSLHFLDDCEESLCQPVSNMRLTRSASRQAKTPIQSSLGEAVNRPRRTPRKLFKSEIINSPPKKSSTKLTIPSTPKKTPKKTPRKSPKKSLLVDENTENQPIPTLREDEVKLQSPTSPKKLQLQKPNGK